MSELADEPTDEAVMTAFTDEVTNGGIEDRLENMNWEPLFLGWCLGQGLDLDRAKEIHGEFRYRHQYDYSDGTTVATLRNGDDVVFEAEQGRGEGQVARILEDGRGDAERTAVVASSDTSNNDIFVLNVADDGTETAKLGEYDFEDNSHEMFPLGEVEDLQRIEE